MNSLSVIEKLLSDIDMKELDNIIRHITKFLDENFEDEKEILKSEIYENAIRNDNKLLLENLKVLIPNLKTYYKNGNLYLCEGDLEHCFGMITFSKEKRKYYYYILTENSKRKVYSAKIGSYPDILKFIKHYLEVKENNSYKKLIEKEFNKKLFIKNIEKDMQIKITEFEIKFNPEDTKKLRFLIDYEGYADLEVIINYITEYIEELYEKKEIVIPDRVYYKKAQNEKI